MARGSRYDPDRHGPHRVVGEGFHGQVYELVRQVPAGRVTTYGDLGAALGLLSAVGIVSMPDVYGETRKLTDCIKNHGWEIQSVGGMPDPRDETRYSTVIKIIADVPMDEVEGIINSAVGDFLSKYLEEHPKSAKAIVQKGVLAAEAREAAKKARELTRRNVSNFQPYGGANGNGTVLLTQISARGLFNSRVMSTSSSDNLNFSSNGSSTCSD